MTDKVSSGGSYPVSLTFLNGLLYVLNAAGDGDITGFRLNKNGQLKRLNKSSRSLDANTPSAGAQPNISESPGEVGFSPQGDFLVVTNKGGMNGPGPLLVFPVDKNGLPSEEPTATMTTEGPNPFSFAFDEAGHLVVVDAATSAVTSYSIGGDGSLDEISSVKTNQAATCWIVVQGSSRFFTDNTGSNTVSSIQIDHDGNLTLFNSDGIAGSTGDQSTPIDLAISQNGKFLYNLETGAGKVGIFKVNADGSLTSLGTAGDFTPVSGTQGIAAH